MRLPKPISFEWDKGNTDKNFQKHRVANKEAEEIFFNKPFKIFPDQKHSQKEERIIALGITNKLRKLAIIFTVRNQNIRIISARDQNKKERKTYEKKQI